MRDPSRLFVRASFGVAVLAALGFGAVQGFAAPAGASRAETARACDYVSCNMSCRDEGHWGGSCVHDPSGGRRCVCIT